MDCEGTTTGFFPSVSQQGTNEEGQHSNVMNKRSGIAFTEWKIEFQDWTYFLRQAVLDALIFV
jgi:hypothetical protein